MKNFIKTLTLLALLILLSSCSSVKVAADYDKEAKFNDYKTFAFFKTGIDKAEISDLDKRRILGAIETALLEKGFTKSDTPDLLVNFFTKEKQQINIYNNNFNSFGYGWGWARGPFLGTRYNVSNSTEGTLYIDLVDTKRKELIWQGIGRGNLTTSVKHKEERINNFVNSILCSYPPEIEL